MDCVPHIRQALTRLVWMKRPSAPVSVSKTSKKGNKPSPWIMAAVAVGFSMVGSSMAFAQVSAQVSGGNASGASIGSSGSVSSTGSGAVAGYSSTGASSVAGYSAIGSGVVSGSSSMGSNALSGTGTGALQVNSRTGVAHSTTGTISGGANSASCLSLDASLTSLLPGC
jgi:hypothetical protein